MIKIIKLISGAEIVGAVTQSSPSKITVDNPLQINYRYFMGPSPTASFIRYCIFGEETTTQILRNHIISQHSVRESFRKVYESNVTYYYGEHQQMIDSELQSINYDEQPAQDERMKKLLEMMPVDGAPVN